MPKAQNLRRHCQGHETCRVGTCTTLRMKACLNLCAKHRGERPNSSLWNLGKSLGVDDLSLWEGKESARHRKAGTECDSNLGRCVSRCMTVEVRECNSMVRLQVD